MTAKILQFPTQSATRDPLRHMDGPNVITLTHPPSGDGAWMSWEDFCRQAPGWDPNWSATKPISEREFNRRLRQDFTPEED